MSTQTLTGLDQPKDADLRTARLGALWRLTPAERVCVMRRGELTLEQLCAWAARYPDQVPLVNGEFEFIAIHTPQACE